MGMEKMENGIDSLIFKYYKVVVYAVEKFCKSCKPEYKLTGLYVIDSICRSCKKDKTVMSRFESRLSVIFDSMVTCHPRDKVFPSLNSRRV